MTPTGKDIIVKSLSKSFNGELVINDLSFEIPHGSKVAVTGQSGSGKSTLVNILMGFIKPDKGSVKLLGIEVDEIHINELRSNTSWVPQELYIDVNTANDLILFPFGFHNNKKDVPSEEMILIALERFGLKKNILSKDISEISGGEKQRIFLAASALLKRKIYFLDEPTSALDSDSKKRVMNYFFHECDATIVTVTHDQEWINNSHIIINMSYNKVDGK